MQCIAAAKVQMPIISANGLLSSIPHASCQTNIFMLLLLLSLSAVPEA